MKHVRLNIAGIVYGEGSIVSLKTHRAVFAEGPSIGNCVTGELNAVLLLPSSNIPRNARIIPYVREGTSGTWIQKSEYFVFSRNADQAGGTVELVAYDAIYRAEEAFISDPKNPGTWPRTPISIMDEIVKRTKKVKDATILQGIDEESRNAVAALPASYRIKFPGVTLTGESSTSYQSDNATTMREMAGWIAAMCAGNWIIDNSGKWRLVKLGDVPESTHYLVTEDSYNILIGGYRILV